MTISFTQRNATVSIISDFGSATIHSDMFARIMIETLRAIRIAPIQVYCCKGGPQKLNKTLEAYSVAGKVACELIDGEVITYFILEDLIAASLYFTDNVNRTDENGLHKTLMQG